MKAFSVDLETTGLKPGIHGITEFGAVFFDDQKPEQEPKCFYRWLDPEGYVWSNYCLQLHADWIRKCTARCLKGQYKIGAEGEPKICHDLLELYDDFYKWLTELGQADPTSSRQTRLLGTGKNFGSFDLNFLKQHLNWANIWRHRTLDWVPFYTVKTDEFPPELRVCKERAILMGCPGITADVAHNALEDALDVYKLIMFTQKTPDTFGSDTGS